MFFIELFSQAILRKYKISSVKDISGDTSKPGTFVDLLYIPTDDVNSSPSPLGGFPAAIVSAGAKY